MESRNNSNIKRALNSPLTRSRIPLANKSNISTTLLERRSLDTRWDHKDSSEGQPSSHDSIYDASWVPETNDLMISPYQTPAPAPAPASPPTPVVMARPSTPPPRPIPPIDPNSESPLSRLAAFDTPFLYGHGTELAPIAEQRSIATLRTTPGNSSLSNASTLLKDQQPSSTNSKDFDNSIQNNNNNNSPPRRPLRRQQSFSLDDMFSSPTHGSNKYYHQLLRSDSNSTTASRRGENSEPAAIGSTSGSDNGIGASIPRLRNLCKRHSPPVIETVDIHAYPQKPTYPPHKAPLTPLRFAEWVTTHEGGNLHPRPYPPHQCSYPAPQEQGQQRQTSAALEVPFRGIRSGHGNLETHPYMRRHSVSNRPGATTLFGAAQQADLCTLEPGPGRYRAPSGPGDEVYAPVRYQPLQDNPPWVCKACGRPADQRWSLLSTLIGQGTGARRGEEWCTRCAWRKVIYLWCCCERIGG